MLTNLDQALGGLQEVLSSLRLRSLLVPVDDRLIRDAVLIVQNLRELVSHKSITGSYLNRLRKGVGYM
jgi:hypothetical protein